MKLRGVDPPLEIFKKNFGHTSPRYVAHQGDHLRGTAEIDSAVVCTPRCAAHPGDNFVIEYLGEIETELENTLACISVAQMGLNHEKNGGRKSRDTLLLSRVECFFCIFVKIFSPINKTRRSMINEKLNLHVFCEVFSLNCSVPVLHR